ncbi:MAG TPA: hypothetical protein PLR76_14645 [Hyphomonas sp.]|nr:DUF805 domain-containing protein [Hyphomonas sp.]MCA8903821.1 DUF805 domain-containing protein [Hyphomonas sp.]MCB9960937.1 DUF805 domain-containing protein [Hyphomonas sp.]MCB9970228.1 DUF805 domain-containing protein [Hyphomonas sp.]HPE49640.1 hypothetical protein [Hyphomonas sp.]
MDVGYVLFSPNGRTGPRDFLRGLILLTGASIIVQLGSTYVSPAVALVQYVLVWSYACVYGKRLHDAGYSAWLCLAFFAGFMVVNWIVSGMLMPLLSPEAMKILTELEQVAASGGFSAMLQAMSERAPEIARKSAMTNLVAMLVSTAVLAFIGTRLRSDPNSNVHGPATGPGNLF